MGKEAKRTIHGCPLDFTENGKTLYRIAPQRHCSEGNYRLWA
jgi:hypothetical protein